MKCPNCSLVNPPGAMWCDCGYDFTTRQLRPQAKKQKSKEMNFLRRIFGDAGKPRTIADQAQEAAGILIVGGYRRLAASQGCAPTSKTSDQKIIEIYQKVATAFRRAADKRGERIPAEVMNRIVWHFLQAYEDSGNTMVESHLVYEVQKYANEGLRPDYNRNLDLLGTRQSEIEEQPKQAKQAVSPAELAEFLGEAIRTWPEKHGYVVKSDFGSIFKKKIDEAFEEITYFLGFSLDLALHGALKTKPTIERAVRDGFAEELRSLAIRNQCRPIPSGEWVGRIWLSASKTPKDVGDPVANLDQRFGLYAEGLKRGQDKPIGESLAYVLAPLCGTTNIAFIVYAARICLGQFEAIRNILESVEIVVRDDNPPAQSPSVPSPSVTAALNNSETAIGQTVALQIDVSGTGSSSDVTPPKKEILVDGLEIDRNGTSLQFEITPSLTSTYTVTYNYAIRALRAGWFTIPSQTICVGGHSLHSPALQLHVLPSANTSHRTRESLLP